MSLVRHIFLAARWVVCGLGQVYRDVTTALMASIAIGAVLSLFFLSLASSIESVLLGEPVLWRTAGGFAVLGISYFLFTAARDHALHRASIHFTAVQQKQLFEQLLRLPLAAYQAHRNSDAHYVAASVLNFTTRFTLPALSLFLGVAELIPLAIVLCRWNPSGLVLSLIALGLLIVVFSGITIAIQKRVSTKTDALFHLTRQILQGIAKLRVLSAVDTIFGHWRTSHQQQERRLGYVTIYEATRKLILLVYVFICLSGWSGQNPGVILGAWLFFTRLIGLTEPMLQLANSMSTYKDFFTLLGQVPLQNKPLAPTLTGNITLKNVTFRYSGSSTPILNNLSFQINPGQRVAIVGTSGVGKSTLMKLMIGMELPQTGAIRYDGIDLQTVDLSSFRRQLGVVTQNSTIAAGSIWENIAGFTQMSIDQAWSAAHLAHIDTVIQDLPMGMHTLVDENASVFSRGQAQRLLLAQALSHQPKILFLDEGMNAIDDDTQNLIFQTLEPLTLIIIAQRLSTMRFMDVIYVLNGGDIVEQGSYDELMAQNGYFVHLIKHQLLTI